MLHLLNKSAFIILLEIVDSLRVFFVFVSIYICILVQVFIDEDYSSRGFKDKGT
jgi:hypothetical protein